MKLFGGGKRRQSAVRAQREDYGYIPEVFNADRMETVVIHSAHSRRRRRPLRGVLAVLAVIVVLAAAAVIGYGIWEKAPDINSDGPVSLSQPESDGPDQVSELPVIQLPVPTTEVLEPEETEDVSQQAYNEMPQNIRNQDCYTFLLAAYDQIGASTDTILVGRMDVAEGTLNVVSIPRDTLVNVSWGVKKINTLWCMRKRTRSVL